MIIHPIPTHSRHQPVPALIVSTALAVCSVIGGVQINHLKKIKRTMHGRAAFALPRARVLQAA